MGVSSNEGSPKNAAPPTPIGIPCVLIALCAFVLYLLSSVVLDARNVPALFGADTWFYAKLARADVIAQVAGDYHLDRITRFHPTTVALAAVWMKLLSPLSSWIAPPLLLQGMFAAVGAAGVGAAVYAFSTVVSRGYAIAFGIVYAASFGVWYFASIEESKIVTASLSALYIACYLRLRDSWTTRGAALLTAILLLACLNEIVSAFLVVLPLIDTLVRRGVDLHHGRWIAVHALAGVFALLLMEGLIAGWLLVGPRHPEGASHLKLLLFYSLRTEHGAANLYSLLTNWVFFNIAAPTAKANYALPAWPDYNGYFAPSLASYLTSPATLALTAVAGVIVAASLLPHYRPRALRDQAGIVVPLLAYSAVRAAFFFIFNPAEALLFSPAVTLAHLLVVGVPFARSTAPAKPLLLAALAGLLLVVNGRFIFGQ